MTVRLSLTSGANFVFGEALSETDLNDTFDYLRTLVGNPSWAQYAAFFTGTGYANRTSSTGITTGNHDWSMAFWVKVTTAPSASTQTLAFIGNNAGNQCAAVEYRDVAGTKKLYVNLYSNAVIVNQTLTVGTWYHIVCTYLASSKTSTIYVNGSSIGSGAHSANLNLTGSWISLGADKDLLGYASAGIDDFRYFESVISAGNIATLYNSGNGTTSAIGGEIAWYLLNNNYHDISGNGNDLTVQGTGSSFGAGKV